MSIFHLLVSEIRYRPVNSILCLLAIVAAALLFAAGPTLLAGYRADTQAELIAFEKETGRKLARTEEETSQALARMDDETRRLMRDLGFNLRIVHRDTNMANFYVNFVAEDMPEEYVHRLAEAPALKKVRHLVATLQQKIVLGGQPVLLVGILPEVTQSHLNETSPMGYVIEPGTVLLGHYLGKDPLGAQRKPGDKFQIQEHEFTIAEILPEKGTNEDIMIAMHLSDAQAVTNKPGKINQILALGCKCEIEFLSQIRSQLETILPETQITEERTKALARGKQRDLVAKNRAALLERFAADRAEILGDLKTKRENRQGALAHLVGAIVPLVVLVSAAFVGLMSWNNVSQRRQEIGVLRALGKGGPYVGALFLGKALLLGLAGGAVGYLVGFAAARLIGQRLMAIGAEQFAVDYRLLAATIAGAPLIAAMATYLPTLSAIRQDPAVVLRDV